MRRTTGNLALAGFDDIFRASKAEANGEQVIFIPLSELHPPEFHPFQVNDDLAMTRLTKNIKRNGVREPGLARPRMDGGYELIAGNRRKRACELAGLSAMPVIVRDMDDDSAAIAMVDSNLEQREKLLYSEKAWAYRVKLEALNHSGIKGDALSVDILAEQTGESKSQIFRLIRLTELVIGLLDKVDARQLAFNPAVELSYLSQKEQSAVLDAMAKYEVKPSLSQSVRLKRLKQDGELTNAVIDKILAETKKPPKATATDTAPFRKYFPPDYSEKQMNAVIIELLAKWKAGVAV
ncbi:ParB/RepB/Spo0J family partition protein [Oscillospiraceae bacterium OttesenSCG-928-F05]|nr:ParB/RepB/Spo0J family partition protein [Oscillospiraceae bacterium OttesenSCG-928-F05]